MRNTRATRRLQNDLSSADDPLGENNGDNGLLLYLAIRLKDEAQAEQGRGNYSTKLKGENRTRLRELAPPPRPEAARTRYHAT